MAASESTAGDNESDASEFSTSETPDQKSKRRSLLRRISTSKKEKEKEKEKDKDGMFSYFPICNFPFSCISRKR